MGETCKSCLYRKPDRRPEFINHGFCRRHPPQIAAMLYDGISPCPESHWPWVEPDDWCGEYKRHAPLTTEPERGGE